jgi:hypothetical protein
MKTFCPFFSLALSISASSRQTHQRNGSGFFHRETLGLERQGSFPDGDEFSERTDPKIHPAEHRPHRPA